MVPIMEALFESMVYFEREIVIRCEKIMFEG